MRISPPTSFSDDDRAVAPLIGFIILFGFLIVALAGYQAQVVPQQNSEIEFQHFQDVRDDMLEVRSSISTAGQADVSQYPTVKLGTNYPPRIFTVNPPPPAGTLQTSQAYNITIKNQSDSDPEKVPTRFLKYQNGYNEMDIGPVWYEHSVLYIDERERGGGIAIYEDQNIVTGNETARVTALQNDFRVSSSGRVTLDLYPTENARINSSGLKGEVTIKIPSRLNDSTYWDEAIDTTESDQLDYGGTEPYPGESDIYWVVLTVDADALKFNTVGIDSAPESQTAAKQGVGAGSPGDTGGDDGGPDPTPEPTPDPDPVCEPRSENVNNKATEDIAVTGSVNVNAKLTGDVTAGGSVTVNSGGEVDGNIQAGGSVIVNQGASVTGDISAGGSVTVRNGGDVEGSIDQYINNYSPCNN